MISIITILLSNSDCNCNHAFEFHPCPSTFHIHQNTKTNRERIKLYQLGNDYLNSISANNEEDEDSEERDEKSIANRFLNAASDVGRRTSNITSGISSVAEKGTSDIQSLAKGAIYGVEKVTKRGTRDIKRTTIKAQQVVKKSTSSLSLPTVGSGNGLADLHFFDIPSFGSNNFSPIVNLTPPKIESEEIVKWIDSQAKSGTEIVSSKAKTLVLNFTGKRSYQFGDVTKVCYCAILFQ